MGEILKTPKYRHISQNLAKIIPLVIGYCLISLRHVQLNR